MLFQLDMQLRNAGILIEGVAALPDGSYRIDFKPEATPQQQQQAEQLAVNFVPAAIVEPGWNEFVAAFQLPGNSLYSSVIAKIAAAGFLAQDHWNNFKLMVGTPNLRSVEVLAASIAYLDLLLSGAGQPLSDEDRAGWTALMQAHSFPATCWL